MKILFVNDLDTAVLSSLNASPNYPVANLQYVFLKKRFQAVVATDTITSLWTSDKVVNGIAVAYMNATALQLRLYSAASALLKTVDLTAANPAAHFAALSGVRYAELDVSNALSSVYLGGIGIGNWYTMLDPLADWADGLAESSTVSVSRDGQALGDKVSPLGVIPYNFRAPDRATYLAIKELVKTVGISKPVYVDPIENDHTKMMPIYALIKNGLENPSKDGRTFKFSLTFQEAR